MSITGKVHIENFMFNCLREALKKNCVKGGLANFYFFIYTSKNFSNHKNISTMGKNISLHYNISSWIKL